MKPLFVNYSKGQMKVQQMAFVLVALVLFFVLAGLFVLIFASGSLRNQAESLRQKEALELTRSLALSPEFSFSASGDCRACIDMDKVFLLSQSPTYKNFWKVPFLQIRRVYPEGDGECSIQNYPDCGTITLANDTQDVIVGQGAFVSLCKFDAGKQSYICELGKILVGFETT